MTDQSEAPFGVSREGMSTLEIVAAEDGCTPVHYVEHGILLSLAAAEAVLENRRAGKDPTLMFIGPRDGPFDYVDVERFLTISEHNVDPGDIGLPDPFKTDEEVPLHIDPVLVDRVGAICHELPSSPGVFLEASMDLRRLLQVANLKGEVVIVESIDPSGDLDFTASYFVDGSE